MTQYDLSNGYFSSKRNSSLHVCIRQSYTQSNQLQLENILAILFTEVQITICGIHGCAGPALVLNKELIVSYVIICLLLSSNI